MKTKQFLNVFLFFSFSLLFGNGYSLDFDFEELIKNFNNIDQNNIEQNQNFKNEEVDDSFKNLKNEKLEEISLKTSQDFKIYLSKYFPKVFVAREKYFFKMAPEDLAKNLQLVIDMLSDKPWIYVEEAFRKIQRALKKEENEKWKNVEYQINYLLERFKSLELKRWLKNGCGFWEFIADQLAFYSEFIEKARIEKGGTIYLEKFFWNDYGFSFLNGSNNQNKPEKIRDYWEKKGINVHYNLYALSFDYRVKLFLEGILNKDLQQVSRYYDDLRSIMEKLVGSKYESERQENMKIYKELSDLLKQKIKPKKDNEDVKKSYFDELTEFYDID